MGSPVSIGIGKEQTSRCFGFFYTLPVQRLFSGNALDNEARFDKEHEEVRFWGVYYSPDRLSWGNQFEFYFLGLNEEDVCWRIKHT